MYVDTNILIYLLEGTSGVAVQVADSLQGYVDTTAEGLVTSTLTITEFLAGSPGDATLLLAIPNLSFVAADTATATHAGLLQRQHGVKLGDAIHLTTALATSCTVLYTNDRRLAGVAAEYMTVRRLDATGA
ncbi:MAG TPA: type II toxin-antitoxin system VapC family toxin [Candidatus Saccharimonadales bacterium]|jgi:predicted nucleic acid-binding protein